MIYTWANHKCRESPTSASSSRPSPSLLQKHSKLEKTESRCPDLNAL